VVTPDVSKQSLGMGYVVGSGVVLSLALVAHAVSAAMDLQALLVVVAGLVPASTLVAANYWLPRSGIDGERVWRVAEYVGLGIGLLTLVNLAVLGAGVRPVSVVPALLASSVAVGGFVGILVGALLELRRSARRLSQSNDVLSRVLRHDMRNDLNVLLGHLDRLEAAADGNSAVEECRRTVDGMIATTEQARQVDVALGADRRVQGPVDLVAAVDSRVAALERAHPDATIRTDTPDAAYVRADWLLGTVLDNLIENAVVHGDGEPWLRITVECPGDTVRVRLVDDGPPIPDCERAVLSARAESQLRHSKGVGLWLVTWTVESYGGTVTFETTDEGGNVVTLQLPAAGWFERRLADDACSQGG